METVTKPVNEVAVGDVVESTDAFTVNYMRVTDPIEMDHAVTASGTDSWFVLRGEMTLSREDDEWEDGDPGELYIGPLETTRTGETVVATVEVVA